MLNSNIKISKLILSIFKNIAFHIFVYFPVVLVIVVKMSIFHSFKDTKRKLEAKMPVPKYATFYNMQHRNRGVAVILNHETFMVNMKLKARAGTSVDAKNLESSLEKLGFKVQVHHNLSVANVDNIVDEGESQWEPVSAE